jgi:hypothetical protein
MANWKLVKSEGRGVRLEARSEEGARRTAEWRLDPRKAVAAAAPEVRAVLDGRLNDDAALSEAKAFGDVALVAEGYAGSSASFLGLFELQEVVVQGRPTYKKEGREVFLYYNTAGCWRVGPDTSDPKGWWRVESAALTPAAITETWTLRDSANSPWVEVGAARIVGRAAFEAMEGGGTKPPRGPVTPVLRKKGSGPAMWLIKHVIQR